ncbi:NADH-quinone oxidoreductase subunit C [Thiospirochaeta perfilievii]|uniref:NADH-quinone oxidoreductase subunit C n=1 Tax=Thiospirochaeta perfilievii TaxID=252967 RepID=A0A5C1QCJ4_9SPIO|nr:NADH-quinone oxidoreductase subunit C [Thiospirochaeta perfilievii]QEN03902.1 NADH-quinone oxidoreductase subunit C [Thiospirochaeta perfilievii]
MSLIIDNLRSFFPNMDFTRDSTGLIKCEVTVNELMTIVLRLHNELSFESLQTISCTDWIEENTLHLNYILYSYTHNETVFVAVKIPRELADDGSKRTVVFIPSLEKIWPQANHFERELWEMFGISVTGHSNLKEFFLEDWQNLPPMRRDFDTLDFVNQKFDFRPGREDNKDVTAERKRVRGVKAALKAKEESNGERENG